MQLQEDYVQTYAAMDLMIISSLSKSSLLHTSKSSNYVIRLEESTKFTKDMWSTNPLQLSPTHIFIPLVLNQCGRRSPHYFEATLKEFAIHCDYQEVLRLHPLTRPFLAASYSCVGEGPLLPGRKTYVDRLKEISCTRHRRSGVTQTCCLFSIVCRRTRGPQYRTED